MSTTVANLKLKRKISKPILGQASDRVKLEKVLGFTVNCGAALSCDSVNGIIAYPAGCTVVLYSSKKNRQAHIINSSKKQISCLAFSPDGRYLATGETGLQPMVRVWDAQERTQVAELPGHKFGIVCVTFSPNMKYLVSVGNQHDMVVNVWNWKSSSKVASNKVSCKVKAISFSECGNYFVTVGVRHVKFWYLERSKTPKYHDTVPLQGRSAILADQRNNNFCDVACGVGTTASSTFCITQSGLLCEFNSRRLLEKWVELKTTSAASMALGNNYIFVGCSEGIVRVFQADTLTFVTTLPRPHYLGVDVAVGHSPSHMMTSPVGARYPDTIALCYDNKQRRLTSIYADHSLYQWEVGDLRKIGKTASFLYHSSCIWGIEFYPVIKSDSPSLPPDTFMTCGSDDTIRFWNLDPNMPNDMTPYKRNIYSQELLKILYTDPEHQFLCDTELNGAEKSDAQVEGKNGVRVIRISPDGRHLAAGDRKGNLRVFRVSDSLLLRELEAHDGDILALEYSNQDLRGPYFLASASRDRIIHVLDVERLYEHVCSMEGHSAAVTSVKFAYDANQLTMLSCGADKSIIFRKYVSENMNQFVRTNCVAAQMTLYDMEMDPLHRWVYTACHDRQIRLYSMKDGKMKKSYKGSVGDDGTLIKLQLENSGSYVATSCSDKNLAIFDVRTGDCVASMSGHGELVTGMKFSNDFRHLISVSGDGCIFVWRLSADLTNQMLSKLAVLEKKLISTRTAGIEADYDTDDTASEYSEEPANQIRSSAFDEPADQNLPYEEDSADLPSWARRQLGHVTDDTPEQLNLQRPAGKWGQRLGPDGGTYTSNAVITDEIFLGPGNSEFIKEKFNLDSQGKSPMGQICHNRGNLEKFGSLANVRLTGGDDEPEHQSSSSVIFYPDSNSVSSQQDSFEVKERSTEISKTKGYGRTDTLGNDLSDDEDSIGVSARSTSAMNLNMNTNLNTKDGIDDLHPRQHKMILDAFENLDEIGAPSPEPTHNNFDRNNSNRNSITSNFLKNNVSGRYDPNMSAASPTPIRDRISQVEALKTQYENGSRPVSATSVTSSLSFPSSADGRNPVRSKWQPAVAPPSNPKYESESKSTTSWSYKPPPAKSPAITNLNLDLDPKNVLRAKNLSDMSTKNRDRRRTLSSFAYALPEDEFIEDDANRRRSRSPATSILSRRDSQGSVFSSASMVGGRSGIGRDPQARRYFNGSSSNLSIGDGPRLAASMSMSSLIFNPDSDSNPTIRKISDLRDKLRKSQENLALSSNVDSQASPSSGVGRSKSIGSLTHAQRSEVSSGQRTEVTNGQRSLASTLNQARQLTKSVGNLHSPAGRPLTETLRDFRKLSSSDLRNRDDDDQLTNVSETSDHGSFYSAAASTTLPRYQKAKGVVQKKAAAQVVSRSRFNQTAVDHRASASGDSEDSSDAQPKVTVVRSASGLISKRVDHYSNRRRAPSSVDPQMITSTPVRPVVSEMTSRRNSSYLAKLLADEGGADEKANKFPGLRNGGMSLVASEGSESGDGHYEKMSSHCKDSVGQFRTALDKILQAYQMVSTDTDLSDVDRQNLQNLLKQELEEARRRVNNSLTSTTSFERHQPEGSVGEPLVISPSAHAGLQGVADPAANVFLQQYSDILVNMIQQKMQQK